ncbi:MAG: hypothetical protein IPL38_05195 [Rhodobacter sp.]|nr:hypothetical protein [Rhodobacter sp.]
MRAKDRPAFGARFGHQAIAKALGGTVERFPGGWVFGLAKMEVEGWPIRLYAAHNEQVTALPAGAEPLGGNAACPFGAFRIGGHILTTQYHPEITPHFAAALAAEYADKLPAEVAGRAPRWTGRPRQIASRGGSSITSGRPRTAPPAGPSR